MKNFIRTSLYLGVFALAGIIFQVSCSSSDAAQAPTDINQIGKIVYAKEEVPVTLWTCNYDGSEQTQIPVTLPANVEISISSWSKHPRVSPDGQTVFFAADNTSTFEKYIYSCNIDGTNPQAIVQGTNSFEIGNAY